jgi:hypothetical protein
VTKLKSRVNRLTGLSALPAPSPCEMCSGWSPQVFVRDDDLPRGEACPVCGRRVPIRLLRIYDLVDLAQG